MKLWLALVALWPAWLAVQVADAGTTSTESVTTTAPQVGTQGFCAIYGDVHVWTFDNAAFDYQGVCEYEVANYCGGLVTLPAFEIYAKNEYRFSQTDVSWLQYVRIVYDGDTVEVSRGPTVQVNGVVVTLPYSGATFTVTTDGFFPRSGVVGPTVTFIWFNTGDLYSLLLIIPNDYSAGMCGICGNFNNIPADDYRTKTGVDVSGLSNPGLAIGDSYVVAAGCLVSSPTTVIIATCVSVTACTTTTCGLIVDVNGQFGAVVLRLSAQITLSLKVSCEIDACFSLEVTARLTLQLFIRISVIVNPGLVADAGFPAGYSRVVPNSPSCPCSSPQSCQLYIPHCGYWCDCYGLTSGNGDLYECWDVVVPDRCYLVPNYPADSCTASTGDATSRISSFPYFPF